MSDAPLRIWTVMALRTDGSAVTRQVLAPTEKAAKVLGATAFEEGRQEGETFGYYPPLAFDVTNRTCALVDELRSANGDT